MLCPLCILMDKICYELLIAGCVVKIGVGVGASLKQFSLYSSAVMLHDFLTHLLGDGGIGGAVEQ